MAGSNIVERIWNWIVDRANLREIPFRRVPYTYFDLDHWLGAIVASAFAWLAITGLLLLIWYDASNPYNSTMRIVNEIPYGKLLLPSHLYAAHLMILSAYIHMFRNFFKAAYKKPRELLWIVGVLAGVMTLNTAFLGYVLVGDITSSDAVNVGKGVVTGIFGTDLGNYILALLFGTSASETYKRVLAFHIISAGLLALLFVIHLALFEAYGPPADPKESRWKASLSIINQMRKDLAPWFPTNFLYILYMTGITWGLLLVLLSMALSFENIHPLISPLPGPPAGVETEHPPYPPWFFLFLYKVADFVFLSIQNPITISLGPLSITIPESPILVPFIVGVVLPLIYLILVPFLDRSDERHPLKRPIHTAIGAMIVVYLIQATIWGALTPGEPIHLDRALAVMIPPMATVAIGIYLLSKRHAGIRVGRASIARGEAAIYVGVLLLIASGATLAIRSWESIMITKGLDNIVSIALGALGSGVGLMILSIIPRTSVSASNSSADPNTRVRVEAIGTAVEVERDIPTWMVILGGFYLFIIIVSAIALAYIDPIARASAIASSLAVIMLALAGISHMAYRTTNVLPYSSDYIELRPHIAVIILMLMSIIGLIPR
ncbi:MAG: cytochrome bc complex cytochrome b subunit [Sulfolobales archaeon]